MRMKEITISAMFIALITIGAWIHFPMGVTSITLQTFFIMLTGLILPRKQALRVVIVYLFMGFIGLPVFAGGYGGLGILAKPQLGFVFGFLPLVWISGSRNAKSGDLQAVMLIIGTAVLYLVGFTYMYVYFNAFSLVGKGVTEILKIGVIPYLPGDGVKIISAIFVFQIYLKVQPQLFPEWRIED